MLAQVPIFRKKRIFFWRLAPELTSAANPPLFDEEDWPWANIRAHLPLFYVGRLSQHGLLSGAMSTPGMQTSEPWATEAERVSLTAVTPGQPQEYFLFNRTYLKYHFNTNQYKDY